MSKDRVSEVTSEIVKTASGLRSTEFEKFLGADITLKIMGMAIEMDTQLSEEERNLIRKCLQTVRDL